MKNKKLFAILTLVCFMMTLMPVAAFAADPAEADMSYFVAADGDQTVTLKKAKDGLTFNAVLQDTNEAPTTGTVYVLSLIHICPQAPAPVDKERRYHRRNSQRKTEYPTLQRVP